MSAIDEIMGAVGRHGDDCIRDGDTASASFEALRELIAAALADAERKGAEQMRTQLAILTPEMASAACWRYTDHSAGDYARAVGAAPLPTGERKDEPLVCDVCGAECADPWHYSSGERRHMHACDACWPGVRKQGGGRQAVLLEDWQLAAAMSEIQPGDELAAGFSFLSWQSGRPDAASALDEAQLVQAAVLSANGLEVRRG